MTVGCALVVLALTAVVNSMDLTGIHIQGNQFVNHAGQVVSLRVSLQSNEVHDFKALQYLQWSKD